MTKPDGLWSFVLSRMTKGWPLTAPVHIQRDIDQPGKHTADSGHQKEPGIQYATECPVALTSHKVEAIKMHNLGPGSYEILDKLQLCVGTSIDLGQGSQLRV